MCNCIFCISLGFDKFSNSLIGKSFLPFRLSKRLNINLPSKNLRVNQHLHLLEKLVDAKTCFYLLSDVTLACLESGLVRSFEPRGA